MNRFFLIGLGLVAVCLTGAAAAAERPVPEPVPAGRFPTVSPAHEHARALLANAMLYVAPEHKIIDPKSGYPVEGWNEDPKRKVFLRSFTQLTAVGQWLELLGDVIAGYADAPGLGREEAIARLTHTVHSLRQDQRHPGLSAKGLLCNFFDLGGGRRLGPLASSVEKERLREVFGPEKGEAIWRALAEKGWILPHRNDREADIRRGETYGWDYFDGPLTAYRDEATKKPLMDILDQRVVMIIFGDNANLSMSAAKTIGALLRAPDRDDPRLKSLREQLEGFLAAQQVGYEHLYDPQVGLFYFGWNATKDRLVGWEDLQGQWHTGHMDYLVNEFRGPATFVVLRYGLPTDALANLGFKIKPYELRGGETVYVLTPWEGSAFQAMGLSLLREELTSPSWQRLLENVVEVELDYARRHGLPGFLSESYTGRGTQYTGDVGIPQITVNPRPRITDAASLYTVGVAYMIAPTKIERFLAENWPTISTLFTPHGPWEGFNVTQRSPIEFQTSAHTFALILGFLGTGPENARRYFEEHGLCDRLAEFYRPGGGANLLADGVQIYAWADDPKAIVSTREEGLFRVNAGEVKRIGVAMVAETAEGMNVSGGQMTLRYRSAQRLEPLVIALKPVGYDPASPVILKEIFTRFVAGDEVQEIRVVLPAMPGLKNVKEIVLAHERGEIRVPIEFSITKFDIRPYEP